jgi:adenine-specific DNA-methyltransferase
MQNLLQDLVTLLEQDDRLVIEGQLFKNKVIELSLALDSGLIRLLLSSDGIRRHFFQDVDGVLVFDKIKFQRFVSNKAFLPDSYTAFKNKIGLTTEGSYLTDSKEVVLAWPYKDCVLEGGQTTEDAKRNEVFWNETLAPDQIDRLLASKVLTNFKKYDKDGEHKVTSISRDDNLIIKGNNLLALHTLKQAYAGRVKLIYIDPPYNTGSDSFKYNDTFNHSTWLTFMRNRLEIAKQILCKDGLIFIQIDDSEAPYLKVLCDEVFGKDNAIINLYVQVRFEGKTLVEDMNFQKLIETTLVYGRSEFSQLNKQQDEYSEVGFCWEIIETGEPEDIELGGKSVKLFKHGSYEIRKVEGSEDALKEIWATGKILDGNSSGRFFRDYIEGRSNTDRLGALYKVPDIGDDGLSYRYFTGPKRANATKGKYYQGMPSYRRGDAADKKKFLPIPNFYQLAESFGNCRHEGGADFRNGKKPEVWISKILDLATQPDDLVLDFFVGSGSTCAVAHKMGRQYIGIEQMDYIEAITKKRLINVVEGDSTGVSKSVDWQGGGSFIYCELAKSNQIFVDQIQEAENSERLTAIWQMMQEKAFLSYRINPKTIDLASTDFTVLSLDDQKRFLIEVMDKNMLYVPASEMDDISYGISDEDKKLNRQLFGEG